jgi:hypothetical protein
MSLVHGFSNATTFNCWCEFRHNILCCFSTVDLQYNVGSEYNNTTICSAKAATRSTHTMRNTETMRKVFGHYLNASMPSNRLQACQATACRHAKQPPAGTRWLPGLSRTVLYDTFCLKRPDVPSHLIECHAGQDWDGVYMVT